MYKRLLECKSAFKSNYERNKTNEEFFKKYMNNLNHKENKENKDNKENKEGKKGKEQHIENDKPIDTIEFAAKTNEDFFKQKASINKSRELSNEFALDKVDQCEDKKFETAKNFNKKNILAMGDSNAFSIKSNISNMERKELYKRQAYIDKLSLVNLQIYFENKM